MNRAHTPAEEARLDAWARRSAREAKLALVVLLMLVALGFWVTAAEVPDELIKADPAPLRSANGR